MKTNYLFPNQFKKIGWIIMIPSAILGFFVLFFDFEITLLDLKAFTIYSEGMSFFSGNPTTFFGLISNNLTNEITGILFLIGAIFTAFSKEEFEDEFIVNLRLESLLWATYINYAILVLCILFFYDLSFLYVLILNMFTTLIFFIVRFNYKLYLAKKNIEK